MHRVPGMDCLIIPDLLLGLLEKEKLNGEGLEFPAVLMDVLLAAQLIKSPRPVKLLEYGSMKGKISFHLAEVLGAFNEESVLVCAYDTIEPEWMEHIAQSEHLPKLSFFAGDFGQLKLSERYFDIIVINGQVNYMYPEDVITDALRLVSEDGILICYSEYSYLLESTFKLYFEKREEYEIIPSQKILLANARDSGWQTEAEPDLDARVQSDIEKAEALLSENHVHEGELTEMTDRLRRDIYAAAASGRNDLKIRLIECKENIIELLGLTG